jgi:hypothetical protein
MKIILPNEKYLKPLFNRLGALSVCSLVPRDGFGLPCSSACTDVFVAFLHLVIPHKIRVPHTQLISQKIDSHPSMRERS